MKIVASRLEILLEHGYQEFTEREVKNALEKITPEKPIRANRAVEKDGQLFMNDDNEYWKCPMCTDYEVPLRENQEYCHYCGQKIDWKKS